MKEEIMLAGHGGQGVLFSGQLLARAAVLEGREVSFVPSYGPEMRGGLSSCAVIISDRSISCPLVNNPTVAIAFNHPSLEALEPLVVPGGYLLVNSSLAERPASRTDLHVLEVPANELAAGLGAAQVANMVMLGALVSATRVVSPESLLAVLREGLSEEKQKLIPVNREALEAGAAAILQAL